MTYHSRPGRRTALALALSLAAWAAPALGLELQGHRGARGLAPENTLAAFGRALAVGVDTLELDLAVTADDRLAVLHDLELNPAIVRGPDGRWLRPPTPRVRDLTLAQLQALDVGRLDPASRYARRYPQQVAADGERVPTLADVVELTARRGATAVRFNVETKLDPARPELTPAPARFARLVVDEVRQLGSARRTTIQSFDWRTLVAVREIAPEIETACLTAEQSWLDTVERGRPGASPWLAGLDVDAFDGDPARAAAAIGCKVWAPYFGDLAPIAIRRSENLGLRVVVWTVNEPDDMRRLAGQGVHGIITDRPDLLREVMAAIKVPLPPAHPP